MKREDIKVLIMRAPGTNCDLEAVRSFEDFGAKVDLIHTQKVFKDKNLDDYDMIVFPGGFSYGDYVRSGAIWAKECEYRIGPELETFVDSGKPIVGICNGFQQLVEMGYLPGWEGHSLYPEAALGNSTHGYQNRWIRMKYEGKGNCGMLGGLEEGHVIQCPVAHGEGRFILPPEQREELLNKLYDQDMVMFRYVKEDGSYADYDWPENPNGAYHDIAGISNPEGTVLGLMPHPERAYYGYLMPEWTKKGAPEPYGDGFPFFKSIVEYIERKF
ncbi:phosphoribosylformylglycinamidine synthase I [Candidatus Bathyarchaeota archaeon]|nr:phosphoribosylformylglycinamidine synthase I [Candidatus Bathyarchaeota archaeon]MBT4423873.1 phosphoribosylformylglycinamidine synthase I [Candidatus Bathyarchaeota archaeon]MBT6604305.1 phosphoribosylformylglycinamidine synthase I [Candidatus Bathyarchaeota archaeon]MBT7187168.1 phosphoribosylformylglycinamidine synthase I [Candidatus Bathyarchaeota archaeon]MBT7347026.1 phosphoribosylformylglycinamidine synthase I [Candidatus Bathyarchaeota archaeon]